MARVKTVWGMACPKCGRDSALEVQPAAWAALSPDGTDFDASRDGTHEWDEKSQCQCTACGWRGLAGEAMGNDPEPSTVANLSPAELATVLAALRAWQAFGDTAPPEIEAIATNGGEFQPLDDLAIDDLCERLNCA